MDKSKHLPSEYENKKSVQFKSPQKGQDQNNTLYHNSVVHDPILITPRHPYTNSLGDDPIGPNRRHRPEPPVPVDPKAKYFLGTVDEGRGGDFFGYYFTPDQLNPPYTGKRKPYITSTPCTNEPLYFNTPVSSGQNNREPERRNLFHPNPISGNPPFHPSKKKWRKLHISRCTQTRIRTGISKVHQEEPGSKGSSPDITFTPRQS